MKIQCLAKTGESLRTYEYKSFGKDIMGRFGATAHSIYGELEIGQEYLVMGVIIFETYQAYLIDNNGFISACPCQLFKVTDDKVASNWHFRAIEKGEVIYPFVQAILGYNELCFDKNSYENLIIEKDKEAMRIYFRRKIEMEEALKELDE